MEYGSLEEYGLKRWGKKGLKTPEEYIESLRKRRLRVYLLGERVKNVVDHPIIRPSVNAVAETYAVAHEPAYRDLATAISHLTGRRVNRFTHIHQSVEDLAKKVKLLRLLGRRTGTCFQRCVGMDALNALSIVTYEMDRELGTRYYERFKAYLAYVQDFDLVCGGAMTDPKGDRGLRPGEQADPDLYLRVVEEDDDGIVVRGAKLHQTGCVNAHEIIVMPTRALRENEKVYAVSFAVPSDAEGLIYVYGRQPCDTWKLEGAPMDVGNPVYGSQEAVIIFDDVFVPWERVFMCGEWQFTGRLVQVFSSYHRQSYGGCKPGLGDVLIGAAQAVAEYQGVAGSHHIRDKIVEMIHLNETLYACGLACSYEGHKEASGTYMVDELLANICKLNVTRFPYEMARLAVDIAGGLLVTMPSEKDLRNPEVGPYLEKYLKAKADVPTEHRLRILRLIANMTVGLGASAYLVESVHGAGSPQAQRIMIYRLAGLEEKKAYAKRLAGIRA